MCIFHWKISVHSEIYDVIASDVSTLVFHLNALALHKATQGVIMNNSHLHQTNQYNACFGGNISSAITLVNTLDFNLYGRRCYLPLKCAIKMCLWMLMSIYLQH